MSTRYDAIVIGTGGVGSAVMDELAQRGHSVLGLDRFPIAHDRGSSHGQTRAIRMAYFEHPDYVPLLRRAYDKWSALESDRGESLFVKAGLLQVGPADGEVIRGVLRSAETHGLLVETLDENAARERLGQFRLPEGSTAVFESSGGFLYVEECVRAHLSRALDKGAHHRVETVDAWTADSNEVEVRTTEGARYHADRLFITGGAWSASLLAELGLELEVLRKPLFWYATEDARLRADQSCPVFLFEVPEGVFYGFPGLDERGIKVAEHTGGRSVVDPLQLDRGLDDGEEARVRNFLDRVIPSVRQSPTDHAVCMYTTTPDGHFIVDRHPEHERVVFCAGLSGHGFKMVNVLAEALVDLGIDGRSELPIGFLSLDRPGLSRGP